MSTGILIFSPDNLKTKEDADLMATVSEVGARIMLECMDRGELSQAEKIIIALHKHAIPFYSSEVSSRKFILVQFFQSMSITFTHKSKLHEG